MIVWRKHLLFPGLANWGHYTMLADEEPTGFHVRHCGHPTALRPYYVITPDVILERKFRLLAEAQAAAIVSYQENQTMEDRTWQPI